MIYLDHHAATPLCAAAQDAMRDAQEEPFWANASSVHSLGRAARALLERAREHVAISIGARPADIILTSGGTEACNMAVMGLGAKAHRVITTAIEHPAIKNTIAMLRARGADVVELGVRNGVLPLPSEMLLHATPDSLVAIQWVNHETGNIFPVTDYALACKESGASFVVDATQALGKLPISVESIGADAIAFASHKIGGPAGSGALWVRRELELVSLMAGGQQERGRRPGTPDVLSAVGFGAACTVLSQRLQSMETIQRFRERLEYGLVDLGAKVNGSESPRVSTVVNASFENQRGEHLVAALDLHGICVSSGPACSSGMPEPSPVLRAMYPDEPSRALGAIRFSLGPENQTHEIGTALSVLSNVVRHKSQTT